MSFDQSTLDFEKERLLYVSGQIGLQLKAGSDAAEKLKKDTMDFQKSMWDHVNPTPKDMDDLANIWQFQTDLVREGSKAIFLVNKVNKLEKMMKNPYFARIDFKEDGCEPVDKIYIGISSIKDEKTTEMLIYDWRAPVCGMFYDYELGRAAYDCPIGKIEGEIVLKRQYRLWNGEIQLMFDSSVTINDDILQEILGKSADSRMKTIVTSIQREQNSVIRNDTHRLLVVTGPAGSGKTSVALHRAAFLLYRYRENITSENIAVFSPNNIFSDYISEVLPELGEANIKRTTFYEYARKTLEEGMILEDHARQMEFLLTGGNRTANGASDLGNGNVGGSSENAGDSSQFLNRVNDISYKSSFEIIQDLYDYVHIVEDNRKFEDLAFNGKLIESEEEITKYFRTELKFLPVTKRLEKIRSRLTEKLDILIRMRVEEVVLEVAKTGEYPNPVEIKGRSIYIVRGEAEQAKRRITEMTHLTLLECYKDFTRSKALPGSNPCSNTACSDQVGWIADNHYIYYEDIAPLLLLDGLLSGFSDMNKIRHVIIDEVQDYTPVQFEIFKYLFRDSNITLLGDVNQAINSYTLPFNIKSVVDIFGFETSISIRLNKSYRSTRQITQFCREFIGTGDTNEFVNREGKLPEVICTESQHDMFVEAVKDINQLKLDGMKSIAVILRTESNCITAYDTLSKWIGISLITAEKQEFFTGTAIIPSYLSKGLEFDAVLVLCTNAGCYDSCDEVRLAYTICTRALHRLHIYCADGFPRFLKNIGESCYKMIDARTSK